MTDHAALRDPVARILREASGRAIVPRFRSLKHSEVFEKSPGDWVTDADHEAEELISAELARLTPGVPIVGEEAAAADPGVLAAGSGHSTAWVLDPLDGTKSFIAGSPDFATMCALVEDGVVTASWIWQPAHGHLYTAVLGGGAFADRERISPPAVPAEAPEVRSGVLRTRYMPSALREAAIAGFGTAGLEHTEVSAAGIAYPLVASGALSHALYWRTLPWDHAPGSLLAAEAGLVVARLDGSPYRPWDGRYGLLTAADQRVWAAVRGALPAAIDDATT